VEDVRQLVLSAGSGTPPGWTPPAQFAVEEAGYLAVTLAWEDSAIEEEGYTLERSTDGQNWIAVAELSANTLRYVDYGLARHTRYGYRLTAHNSQGSDSPRTVQAETASEPVSFGAEWVEGEIAQTVIDYQYDALYRLTEANYSDGTFFHYAYDSNGNRVSETTVVGTVESVYDTANRLTSVGASSYTWDANGNLVNDGRRTYVYNTANRLTGVAQNGQTVSYSYNGPGDRLVEGDTQFEMDLNTGLTQALSDGTNTYLYGIGRIGQFMSVNGL
jgi:YD repeat-containing protein